MGPEVTARDALGLGVASPEQPLMVGICLTDPSPTYVTHALLRYAETIRNLRGCHPMECPHFSYLALQGVTDFGHRLSAVGVEVGTEGFEVLNVVLDLGQQ